MIQRIVINNRILRMSGTILMLFLLNSTIFTLNVYGNNIDKNNNSEAVLESLSMQDCSLSISENGKTPNQISAKVLRYNEIERSSLLDNYTNSIKNPLQHYRLLSFQFFLLTQFSTGT